MIYGQDEPMLFPVADLYDSAMMQMYINAAREQYNQNREDMKEFRKLYGDFTSPFAEDIAWVDQQTRGRINDALNYMQANGIDPLRSAEGRALIQQIINNTDTAGINLRKQAAANKILWDKSIADLKAKNLYNKDFVDWDFAQRHGVTPDKWSTEKNGLWTDTSADPYQDLNQYTGHIFDKMEDDYMETKDGYDYFGVNRDRRMGALTPQVQDLLSTQLGKYHYEQAAKDAAYILGRTPTEQEVLDQFKSNVLDATKEYEHRTRKENEEYGRSRQFYWSDKLDANKSARDLANQMALDDYTTNNKIRLEEAKGGLSGGSSSSNSGGGSAKEQFSDAQYQMMRGVANILNQTSYGRASGIMTYADVDPDGANYLVAPAQEEIAAPIYNNLSTYDNVMRPRGSAGMFTMDLGINSTNKIRYNDDYGKIRVGNFDSIPTIIPATTNKQKTELKEANEKYINKLSMDYSPRKFAVWTNKSTFSGDSSMINITNDDDAKNRIYSVNEIALSSHGVDRPDYDVQQSVNESDGIRKLLEANTNNIYMKSVGKVTAPLSKDGAMHMYQMVKIYTSDTKGKKLTENKKIGIVLYDMGIDTYSNPNFGVNNNTDTNLYFDETKDADVRFSGDMNVSELDRIGAPEVKSTISVPQLP